MDEVDKFVVKDAVPRIRRQSVNSSIEATTGDWVRDGRLPAYVVEKLV